MVMVLTQLQALCPKLMWSFAKDYDEACEQGRKYCE